MGQRPDIPDDQVLVEQATDISGGVSDSGEEHLIPPNKTAFLLNIDPTFDGQRQKRFGVLPRGSPGLPSANANGAFPFEIVSRDFRHVVVQQDSNLFSTDGLSLSFTPRVTTFSLSNTFHHATQGQGQTSIATLFVHSVVPVTNNASLPWDPLLALDRTFTATSIEDVRPRSAIWYQKRLWCFNSASTLHGEDYLVWSNVLDGRNFSNGQNVQIDPEGGDPGSALLPLRGDTPRMLLFKERSIHLLDIFWDTDGFFPSAANTLDFLEGAKVRPVVSETGCIATRGLTWVPGISGGDVLFLSREGIRSLNRSATDAQGGAGLPLSFPIQRTIDRINFARADRATAVFWEGRAYFALPVDGNEQNNFVLAYDVNRNAWFFYDWEVNSFLKSEIDPQRKFYFFGQTSGTDGQSSVTVGHHLYETDRGNVDPLKIAVKYQEETRAFVFSTGNDPAEGLRAKKLWRWLELKIQGASTGVTLVLDYKVDSSTDWVSFRTLFIDPSDSFPVLPVQLPFTFDAGEITRKNVSLHGIQPGFRLQFRFTDDISFGRIKILEKNVKATQLQETFS